jgi:hypothetical protein
MKYSSLMITGSGIYKTCCGFAVNVPDVQVMFQNHQNRTGKADHVPDGQLYEDTGGEGGCRF